MTSATASAAVGFGTPDHDTCVKACVWRWVHEGMGMKVCVCMCVNIRWNCLAVSSLVGSACPSTEHVL